MLARIQLGQQHALKCSSALLGQLNRLEWWMVNKILNVTNVTESTWSTFEIQLLRYPHEKILNISSVSGLYIPSVMQTLYYVIEAVSKGQWSMSMIAVTKLKNVKGRL